MNENQKSLLYCVSFLLAITILAMFIVFWSEFLPPSYVGHYWDSAPDGVYHVLVYPQDRLNISGKYYFPVCPDSNSQLHGIFPIREGLTFDTDVSGAWYWVRVENNTIVETWKA